MRGPPAGFWGKLRPGDDGRPPEWHPLADHCADVAACCEALLQRTLLRRRLARLGGIDELSPVQVARLSVLAALHDIGKFNIGFQNKALGVGPLNGHVREVLGVMGDAWRERELLFRSLPFDELCGWGADETALRLLVASIAHHGRPFAIGGNHQETPWRPARGLDPFAGIADLSERTRRWFPDAFRTAYHLLPAAPHFQHAFSGLVMLADWLGSDTTFFPFSEEEAGDRIHFARSRALLALRKIGVDSESARDSLGEKAPAFDRISAFEPRLPQRHVLELPTDPGGSISLLEAETGSGKTEAALARYVRLFHAGLVDGMYFALPTRTAATQIHGRVFEAVARAFPDPEARPPVVLAVPGYIAADDRKAYRLPDFKVLWNDDPQERFRFRGWAAEHPKRYLVGPVVVGTIDQVLLSTLMVNHAHLRATALLRHLLVVDEVHASDAYMTALLEQVLDFHVRASGHALLMSATLGASARQRLLSVGSGRQQPVPQPLAAACATPYPLVTHCATGRDAVRIAVKGTSALKDVRQQLSPSIGSPEEIARQALDAAVRGARVLVLRNTVGDCVATQQALEALAQAESREDLLFHCEGVAAPHHARFAKEDREVLDAALGARFGKDAPANGCVVAATQTVQQSLDLDADLLITDLCPMDVLLQRIGRLHRHERARPAGFEEPAVVVLMPADRDLSAYIQKDGRARGAHGLGTVYDDLRILEATWRALSIRERLSIPQMNRQLVEETTHPEALQAIVTDLGGRWPVHATRLLGSLFADRRAAELNIIDREQPFGEIEFPSRELERRIQTRLGEGDRLVDFDPLRMGPFGHLVGRLSVPAYLARGVPSDAQPTELTLREGAISFAFGFRSFIYDRLGLRAAQALPPEEEELADA
jgi:CRISPR-associated endonuclease/helicase Cas3